MKSILLLMVLILTSSHCLASKELNKSISIVYGGFTFNAPAIPLIIAQPKTSENTLILKYSKDKGVKYLSFSNFILETQNKCFPEQLLSDAFTKSKNKFCSIEDINSFKKIFIEDAKIENLEKNGSKIYFSYLSDQIFIFVTKKGQSLKIESDFINKDQIRLLIAGL